MSRMPEVGERAPLIEADTYNGERIRLSDFLNNKIIALYFYPRDNTPGCTREACSMRDGMDELGARDIRVLGVSTDSVRSHENFKNKYNLNFPLLSDSSKSIVRKYGVESDRGSARRVTFLIDKKGIVRYIWKKVQTERHADEVVEKAKELNLV